jgi:hypothetical protein
MAASEIRVLNRPCLKRRLDNIPLLRRAIAGWEAKRKAQGLTRHWRVTIALARAPRWKLDPSIDD